MSLPPDIRTLFDTYQRKATVGATVQHTTESLVRGWLPAHKMGFVMYSALTEETADAVIADQIAYFTAQAADEFEWKYYDYDTPADLPQRLVAHGLQPEAPEAVLVLDMMHAPDALLTPPTHDIRRITDVATLSDADSVHNAIWNTKTQSVTERVTSMWDDNPASISLYIAYVDDQPVSYGRVEFMPEGNPFASIWGGSTLPAYRRRGIYTQLVAARLQEARQRGYRYLTVDANPQTSMPILQRLGFQQMATSTPYIWHHPQTRMT